MIRNNLEFQFNFDTISSFRIFDQFHENVNDFLIEFNEKQNSIQIEKQEFYINKIKRRQFVFTFENVKINKNDVSFFLNVINVNQLK